LPILCKPASQSAQGPTAKAAMNRNKPPIFVVGVPRSGTTLLAAMLAAHSRLSCGTETRFFHFLAKSDAHQLCQASSWPDRAVDYLFAMQLVDVPVPELFGTTREQVSLYLKDHPPTVASILSALTEPFMEREGKSRWVEKSPEHLMHVYDIRKHFPQSPIIRIVRDPRDVALSLRKAPWASPHFLENLMLWRSYDEASARFFQNDPHCHTVSYENLVQSPENELRQLCAFIGEEYEPQMLDTSRSAGNVVTNRDTWHRIVHKPVDSSRTQVWKRDLSPEENRLAEALLGDRLSTYGYECNERFDRTAAVYPTLDLMLSYRAALQSFADAGVRFWRATCENKSHLLVYVGEPDRDRWLSHEKVVRWTDTLRIVLQVLGGKLARQGVYWVRGQNVRTRRGHCGRVLAFVFRLTAECRVV
jgi:hypothetical protein